MSVILDKRLSELREGDLVQITLKDMSCVSGVVSINAPEDREIAIQIDAGDDAFSYDMVERVKKSWQTEAGVPKTPQVSVEAPNIPVLTASPEPTSRTVVVPPPVGYSKRPTSLYDEDFDTLVIKVNDNVLKTLFSSLTKTENAQLGSAFESFKYGEKNNDVEKQTLAAKKAKVVFNKGTGWSLDAARFVGGLLCRTSQYDETVYSSVGLYSEAAMCCYVAHNYSDTAAYASAALVAGETTFEKDIYRLLCKSCVKGSDVSALFSLRNEVGAETFDSRLEIVVNGILEHNNMPIQQGQDIPTRLRLLGAIYPGNESAEKLTAILKDHKSQDHAEEVQDVDIITEDTADEEKPGDRLVGWIETIQWVCQTGVIRVDSECYDFHYSDIAEKDLKLTVAEQLDSHLDGRVYWVSFAAKEGNAKDIKIAEDPLVEADRAAFVYDFQTAVNCCRLVVSTPKRSDALRLMVKYAVSRFHADKDFDALEEAEQCLYTYQNEYPGDHASMAKMGEMYYLLGDIDSAVKCMDEALACEDIPLQSRLFYTYHCARYIFESCGQNYDASSMEELKSWCDSWIKTYTENDVAVEASITKNRVAIYKWMSRANAILGNVPEATAALQIAKKLNPKDTELRQLQEIIQDAKRAAIRRGITEAELEKDTIATKNNDPFSETGSATTDVEDVDDWLNESPVGEAEMTALELSTEEEIVPYKDDDGWGALNLSKRDVIDYALSISTDNPNPAMLAYLRAGALLNEDVRAVYQTVALAVNDPAAAPDYTIANLQTAFMYSDSEYAVLTDYCMAAAYLRTSFLSGRGYDYSSRAVRDSINAIQIIQPLAAACDTLDEFRNQTGRAIDIYADYRNLGAIKLNEDIDRLVRKANELNIKYILTPPRDSIHFARMLNTKKVLFAKDGDLASFLQLIISRSQGELENRRKEFSEKYLNGSDQIIEKNISTNKIDELIENAWGEAGQALEFKKANSTLQGDRRNNIRSNIAEILRTVCQWYILSDQGAGLTWRTEEGKAAYECTKAELLEQLAAISDACTEQMTGTDYPEEIVGLRLVSDTAKELAQRLNGTWRFEQERFFYSDFLKSDNIMLNEEFMPELESTFCALTDFNVLARIRHHVEGEKTDYPQRLGQIFGQEKTHNNYGTAERILAYASFFGFLDKLALPTNSDQYISQTEQQIAMRFHDFQEIYALAMNYGQIMKSDSFCVRLEETIRYWYAKARQTKNYGFFVTLVQQAEKQIHASAQDYEHMLEEQLDVLIQSNKAEFEKNEGFEDAIRAQIAQQNFTVVDDWMSRVRDGDFSLVVKQPEALAYLEEFWTIYADTCRRVSDASKSLDSLFNRQYARNKDERGASQLAEAWLKNGNTSTPSKIEKLLNLLGWQKLQVEPSGAFINTEAYTVRQDQDAINVLTPPHPIAAFGSKMSDARGVYVVCLYGTYHADTLYEKIRALDSVAGNKIILLDYALSVSDRHAIARKMKQRESGIQNVYLVIDRVLFCHLADNYNKEFVNRRLMAIGMPFSYYQPYVAESAKMLPPEMFVGRKEELQKVKSVDGVNLIYGGRQLGKSALFKKARVDIDGVDNQRAVLVDINGRNCASAAQRLSTELKELGILPDIEMTDDWEELCDGIRRRLRSKDDIAYLLIMLDEADAFIQDCSNSNYAPLIYLKDLQQSVQGKFKFVLAGLHNVVRFTHEIALGSNAVIPHFSSLKISPFRAPEAQELLSMPLSYLGLSLPSRVTVSQILATANYFPGLIQMYCEKLIESLRAPDYAGYNERNTPPYVISDNHIRRVLADRDFIHEIHEKFEATLRLDQDQGSYYYPLALLIGWMYFNDPDKVRTGYTATDILDTAKDMSVAPIKNLVTDQIETLLQELEDLNMLRSISDKSYVFASKNFRDLLGTYEDIFEKLDKIGGAA